MVDQNPNISIITLNVNSLKIQLKAANCWEFPRGPVVRTQHFHSMAVGSIPGLGTKIPQAVWHGQKKIK